jgi:superfamily II DNA/RNA helicase
VVLFSQWLRTHELLVRRLEQRKWEHVVFHGGVSSRNRRGLIQRFKEDPRCRLFLATDAGGVGLNLQNADTVIVLDQPWNPGVLEQRIGRVHRLGQHRPVRVVHFVAQGAIEEGMLGVLAFKKSMFAGVLDGGKDEVFLGGTRLKRFMESVEKVTNSIPTPAPSEPEPRAASEPEPASAATADSGATPQQQAWNDVLAAGASLLEKLGQALDTGGTDGSGGRGKSAKAAPGLPESLLSQDESTGQTYVKLPLPDPEMLQKIVGVLGSLAGRR